MVFPAVAVKIPLRNREEGLLAGGGVNLDRIHEPETQRSFGENYCWPAAREQDCTDSGCRSNTCPNRCATAPVRRRSNQSAKAGCAGNRSCVLALRSAG